MSRLNLRDAEAEGLLFKRGIKVGSNKQILAATKTLSVLDPPMQILDPNAASQKVLLPAEADSAGLVFFISSFAGAAEDLVVNDDADAVTIATVSQAESAIVWCDGITWYGGVLKAT